MGKDGTPRPRTPVTRRERLPRSARPARSGAHPLRVATVALVTAGIVVLAGGGDGFWLCLPSALIVSGLAHGRAAAFISAAAVTATAALPLMGWLHIRPLPSPVLAVLVVAASVAVLRAVRERLEREREALRNVALTDPLTGIANRRLLMSRAEYEIARHTRARQKFAVVLLDLDGFKLLNDRFGHAAGDELLCDVAVALAQTMRGQDTVARIGGDEFCVLAPETDSAHATPLARRIATAVVAASGGLEALRASLGVSVFPDDGTNAHQLLQVADQRLLATKRDRPSARARRRAA